MKKKHSSFENLTSRSLEAKSVNFDQKKGVAHSSNHMESMDISFESSVVSAKTLSPKVLKNVPKLDFKPQNHTKHHIRTAEYSLGAKQISEVNLSEFKLKNIVVHTPRQPSKPNLNSRVDRELKKPEEGFKAEQQTLEHAEVVEKQQLSKQRFVHQTNHDFQARKFSELDQRPALLSRQEYYHNLNLFAQYRAPQNQISTNRNKDKPNLPSGMQPQIEVHPKETAVLQSKISEIQLNRISRQLNQSRSGNSRSNSRTRVNQNIKIQSRVQIQPNLQESQQETSSIVNQQNEMASGTKYKSYLNSLLSRNLVNKTSNLRLKMSADFNPKPLASPWKNQTSESQQNKSHVIQIIGNDEESSDKIPNLKIDQYAMIIKQYSGAKDPEKNFDRGQGYQKTGIISKEEDKKRQNFLRTSFEDQSKLKSMIVSPSNQLTRKNFSKSKHTSPEKQLIKLQDHKQDLETEDFKKKNDKVYSPLPLRDYKRPRVSYQKPLTSTLNHAPVTELASRGVQKQNYNYHKPQFDSFLNEATGRGTSRRNSRFDAMIKPGYRENTGIHQRRFDGLLHSKRNREQRVSGYYNPNSILMRMQYNTDI